MLKNTDRRRHPSTERRLVKSTEPPPFFQATATLFDISLCSKERALSPAVEDTRDVGPVRIGQVLPEVLACIEERRQLRETRAGR